MAGEETTRPCFTMSGGRCNGDQVTSTPATDLDNGRNPEDARELPLSQQESQAAYNNLVCFDCGVAFAFAEAFQDHMTTHTTRIPGKTREPASDKEWNQIQNTAIVCHLCGAAFTDMDTFQRHNAGHENKENIPSQSGHTTPAEKEDLQPLPEMQGGPSNAMQGASCAGVQQDTARVPEETSEAAWHQQENQATNRIQECHVCGFGFTDAEAFQKHAADHSLGKNHSCPECGKLFKRHWPLTRHLGTHGEPSFECGVCGKKYYTKDGRKRHMLSCRVGAQESEAVEGSP
ncbi:uncharacterized protein [Dermacentor andersoni]|uniref:uncharacterized protein isoform X3 n=1 Tax=Dermacentor andersoni TaxID=34620 RepID=UPI002417C617|nr:zinc finger protein 2-like isoform X3 [Dermacentor andersoni]